MLLVALSPSSIKFNISEALRLSNFGSFTFSENENSELNLNTFPVDTDHEVIVDDLAWQLSAAMNPAL